MGDIIYGIEDAFTWLIKFFKVYIDCLEGRVRYVANYRNPYCIDFYVSVHINETI